MYKNLRLYYLYAFLPFGLLIGGAIYFFDAVKETITSNPHPQINYAIFIVTLFGGVVIMKTIGWLTKQGKVLILFSDAMRSSVEPAKLQELALDLQADIAYVLRMIAASAGRPISSQEQQALESEVDKVAKRLNSRAALPQFLSGLLVGLGLLGTFIGLLATLGDISSLIGSFASMDVSKADPIQVFRTMVDRMQAPMRSMAIAFSASMFGLLGSIVLGLMLLALRRCAGDVLYRLNSEVAQHIEFALARDGFVYSKSGLKKQKEAKEAGDTVMPRPEPSPSVLGTPIPFAFPGMVVSPQGTQGEGTGTLPASSPTPPPSATPSRPLLGKTGIDGFAEVDDQVRILMRIEERLAESARTQERSLLNEVEQFTKQRGELFRVMGEHAESVSQFRGELQRVGRQLGNILGIMEKGNSTLLVEINENFAALNASVDRQAQSMSSVSDAIGRMTEDSAITRRGMLEMMRFMQSLMLQRQVSQGDTLTNVEINPPTRPNSQV